MQKTYNFYEHDERIPIPPSFNHIVTQDDGTHIMKSYLWPINTVGIRTFFKPVWLGNKENLEIRPCVGGFLLDSKTILLQ